ncbi:MAG TPA: hypothetical protein VK503_01110, partial [Candidatus Bathyarchaeia archaeon]|nr:hypothetical protein [Candidatus Bathyarchaeia archaeon]
HSHSTITKSQHARSLRIRRGRRKVIIQTLELDKEVAREIFLVACRGNSLIPEALRIAELVTQEWPSYQNPNQVRLKWNSK